LAAKALGLAAATLQTGRIGHPVGALRRPGNLLAMPVVSAVIMPMGILGVVSMPFGFDGVFWHLMGEGIDWMV
jgi:hypothetical protein